MDGGRCLLAPKMITCLFVSTPDLPPDKIKIIFINKIIVRTSLIVLQKYELVLKLPQQPNGDGDGDDDVDGDGDVDGGVCDE